VIDVIPRYFNLDTKNEIKGSFVCFISM